MTKLLCASTAVVALVLASVAPAPVRAADLSVAPIYKAAPAPVTTWTGGYLGVSGGGTWGRAVVHNDTTGADQTPRLNLSGGMIGYPPGYKLPDGNRRVWYEGDTSITSKKGSAFEFPPNGAFNNEIKERWLSTFRGRVGYAQDDWLLYATAGGALAQVENNITGPGGSISDKHWHWGWTAGV